MATDPKHAMDARSTPAMYGGKTGPRRDETIQMIDARGPDNCYGCGAPRGMDHSVVCPVAKRGKAEWIPRSTEPQDWKPLSGALGQVEHKMVSARGVNQRGWRKTT
jgi:hypothetical protein